MDHLLSKEQPHRKVPAMVKRPSWAAETATSRTSILLEQVEVFRIPSGPRERSDQRLSARRDRRPPGGIAQLVERQLCKLDAAGSNPAASTTLRKRGGGLRGGEGV